MKLANLITIKMDKYGKYSDDYPEYVKWQIRKKSALKQIYKNNHGPDDYYEKAKLYNFKKKISDSIVFLIVVGNMVVVKNVTKQIETSNLSEFLEKRI